MIQKSTSSMRILMVIPSIRSGGAERQLGYLSRGLAGLGHEIHIATFQRMPPPSPDQADEAVTYRLGGCGNYDPRLLFRLRRLVRKVDPDIVQTWNPQTDILGGAAAIMERRMWIIREPISAGFYRGSWKAGVRRMLSAKVDAVIANSAGGADYWRGFYPDKPLYVVRNGLPLPEITRAAPADRGELGIGEGQKLILYVGRLTGQKRVDRLIESVAALKETIHPKLMICGEGEDAEKLEFLARALGVGGRVQFMGFLETKKIWSLMKTADLFVSLSDFEGMPNTVMEAMACNCPVLVSDISSHREIVERSTGWLVHPTDLEAISRKVAFLLSPEAKNEIHSRTGAAREKAQAWSMASMVENYEEIFRKVIAGPSLS